MKIGDLIEYIEPGIEMAVARGIVVNVCMVGCRLIPKISRAQVLWDMGHLTWVDNVCLEVINESQ